MPLAFWWTDSKGSTSRRWWSPNDADFASAMRYVRDDLGLRVTLVNPDARNASPRELAEAATYVKRLWKSHLRRSQLPETVTDEVGDISKPTGW